MCSRNVRLLPRPINLPPTVSCNRRPCKDFLVPRGSIFEVTHNTNELMGLDVLVLIITASFGNFLVAAEVLIDIAVDFLEHIPVYHAAFKQHF